MLTFASFTGINNILPSETLVPDKSGAAALIEAMNVDIDLAGKVSRRDGFAEASDTCHKNVWQGDGFMLATADSDLINVETQAVLYPSLGVDRVWYTNLPDGRTTFSNGLINGITDGTTATNWGVPLPAATGASDDVAGSLFPGRYRIAITHVRLSDGLEGGTTELALITLASGGIVLTGLPLLAGHKTNVYLSSHDDETIYLAGSTTGSSFSFTAANDTLTLACKTEDCYPAPAGILTAFWHGRTLIALGPTLLASKPQQVELFDVAKDFKPFSANITLVQPVDAGIYVGTETELVYLSGTQFDNLALQSKINGRVVLGSGVTVDGAKVKGGSAGDAMLCIANRLVTVGFNGGTVVALTEGQYATDVTEVAATFRMAGDIPQYIAIPQ